MTAASFCCALCFLAADPGPMPLVLDDRLQLELVAAEPDIVTPTGIGVDAQGKVFVIESNTHFPPENYRRSEHDRILVLEDFAPDGKAGKIRVFFEGTRHTMNLAFHPDGSLYVATRREIFRLTDEDRDGKADQTLDGRQKVAWLETKGNYPHNGLSGFAFDLAGNVYFGFGENLGAEYKLIGTDGTTLSGGGEGGNIYCCDAKGGKLRRVATGFWNPFHLGFDAFGRLFAVDNDPDSRPPCRLLHIVEGGDYGYRYRNGRKGVHPFTAWNGELPGTLPMVAGTGEAPCAVLAYESDNLPEEYRGDLLVTSWGDHRIERYKLKPRGASFSATMTPVVRGGENFRPVGMALAPDGSIYFSDWVDKSYDVHGKGRVWRLSAKNPPKPSRPEDPIAALSSPHGPWREAAARKLTKDEARNVATTVRNPRAAYLVAYRALDKQPADVANTLARVLSTENMLGKVNWLSHVPREMEPVESVGDTKLSDESIADLVSIARPHPAGVTRVFESTDPFMQHAAVRFWLGYAKANPEQFEQQFITKTDTGLTGIGFRPKEFPDRMAWAIVARRSGNPRIERLLPNMLVIDDDPNIQLFGVIWAAESRNHELRPELEKLLATAKTRVVFQATLAALEMLDGKKSSDPTKELGGDVYVLQLLKNEKTSPEVRRFALRMLRPEHEQLTLELLTKLIHDEDEGVRLEAIRTLRARPDSQRWQELREIAADEKAPIQHRCEAILGLSPGNKTDRELLLKLAESEVPAVSDEALRALRGFDLTADEMARLKSVAEKLDGPHRELAQRVIERHPPKDLPKGTDLGQWLSLTSGEGNAEAGERIFYHPRVGGCFRCHEYEGRGYTVGPDLSPTGKALTRERLLESIVNPSQEVAPMFTTWTILKTDGEQLIGIHIGDEVDGRIKFADQDGRVFHVHPNDIEQRKPSEKSIMPDNLADNLTPQELRDLLAFLMKR